jgi:hypothetical protein
MRRATSVTWTKFVAHKPNPSASELSTTVNAPQRDLAVDTRSASEKVVCATSKAMHAASASSQASVVRVVIRGRQGSAPWVILGIAKVG